MRKPARPHARPKHPLGAATAAQQRAKADLKNTS